ncbi:catechol 1,2-dioxygenase/chlorocatechol 1,2-dioxygenase [Paraburkholderia sp. BL6669N2]|uniref:dioxygenase family protein n=1 Tax=Paraburkholderia sp. BL6669N2 TaxID=1938807 RepID=UPI000E27E5A8|nr:dioxygenase [Paraburkholderia sp. BL6669N2]REG49137.1 catechol 1,2-dioxygenase/chlorocatechol 1,2-dioxygenase [Paraburkholderia sp. BL6669N2]
MSTRSAVVIHDILKSVREALWHHDVTFEEYRAAVGFLRKYAQSAEFEIPLTCDMLFNATISDIEMKHRKGSVSNLEGPYFLEAAPTITDRISTRDEEGDELIIEGQVRDLSGNPIEGAELYIWHSDSQGLYSGFSGDFPIDLYRGKKIIGPTGEYSVRTTMPAPYMIPHDGPSGELLGFMGRHPWRPAHVHFKVRAQGFLEFTTQAYFAGGDWVDSDCVEGVRAPLVHDPEIRGNAKVLKMDFVLDPA